MKTSEFLNSLPMHDFIWIIEVVLILLIIWLAYYFEKKLYQGLQQTSTKTKNIWDNTLIWAIHKPLQGAILLVGLFYAAKIASSQATHPDFFDWLPDVEKIGLILLGAWAFLRFSTHAEKELSKRAVDKTAVHALGHVARIVIMVATGIIIMQSLDFDLTALLAFGGAGSLVIGIAAKDLLANFFGALIIYLDRPFKVGDWIRSPDKNIEGFVEYIGWRITIIRSFERRPLYIPNAVFTTIVVENPSRMTNRRLKESFGVRYKDADKIPLIVKDLEAFLQAHPAIDQSLTIAVNLHEFAPSSLNCLYYAFTKSTLWVDFQATKESIMMEILSIVERHGAEMAFPTTTLEIPDGVQCFTTNKE